MIIPIEGQCCGGVLPDGESCGAPIALIDTDARIIVYTTVQLECVYVTCSYCDTVNKLIPSTYVREAAQLRCPRTIRRSRPPQSVLERYRRHSGVRLRPLGAGDVADIRRRMINLGPAAA
jgi:hypothetical protein